MREQTAVKRATLRDIAQDVGVSIGTVSVILNGARSGTSVADRTRDAIHESARRLGYRPNWVAKSLRGGKTRTIGIIPTIAGEDFLLGPYVQRVLNSVVNVLAAEHHDVLLLTRCDQSDVRGILEGVVNGRIDGAIVVAPRADSRLVETLEEAAFPFVVIDGADAGHPGFTVDDAEGTCAGLDHLRALGHERIAYVAGPPWLASGRARLKAFQEAWESLPLMRGGVTEPLIAHGDFSVHSGHEAVRELLNRVPRPTAVLCANDEMAMGAYRAAREAGLAVPQDLSVVGFDDSPNSADAHPPLTTYEQPVERMAAAAAQAILGAVNDSQPGREACFSGHFVVRQSTSCPKQDPIQ